MNGEFNMQDESELLEDFDEGTEELNIPSSERGIYHQTNQWPISSLYEKYKDNDLILNPDYQRYYVWDTKKASNLIESIILNIPIPAIFTSEEENNVEEVIDGQQRLQSIFSFIDGKFPNGNIFRLSNLKILKDLSGKKFSDLETPMQKTIKKRALQVTCIKSQTHDDIKFEMFERLNTNITKLNAQELRNCIYRGKYMDFLKRMSCNKDFLYIINQKEIDNKRMLHEELVLVFCSLVHIPYLHYKSPLKQFLNADAKLHRNASDDELSKLEGQFKKSIDLIRTIFDKDAFKVFSIDEKTYEACFSSMKVNQGLYFILMYCFTLYEKNQVMPFADLIREELLNLQIHNSEFRDTLTGSGTNSKEKIIKKFDIWRDTLKGIMGYPVKEPRSFTYQFKKQLWESNPTCSLCDQKITHLDNAEVDHIFCFWQGGKTIPSNARLAHRACNRMRGADK